MAFTNIMHVRCMEAEGIKDSQLIGQQDVYCRLVVGETPFDTSTAMSGGTKPKWGKDIDKTSFRVNVADPAAVMKFVLVARGTISDTRLGDGQCELKAFFSGEVVEEWFQVSPKGRIKFRVRLMDQFDKPLAKPIGSAAPAGAPLADMGRSLLAAGMGGGATPPAAGYYPPAAAAYPPAAAAYPPAYAPAPAPAPAYIPAAAPATKWECSACTYVNNAGDAKCAMCACEGPKVSAAPAPAPAAAPYPPAAGGDPYGRW